MTTLKEAKFLIVSVVENYERNGEQGSAWHEVGRAWLRRNKAGAEYLSVKIHPGISVTGDLMIQAPLPKRDDPAPTPAPRGDGGEKGGRFGKR